jgi:chitinase
LRALLFPTVPKSGIDDIKAYQAAGKKIILSIGGEFSAKRPFGDAVVDGFDLDFESPISNLPDFANRLRSLFSEDRSKTYYLTAAPQCPYPDIADNSMLDGSVYFDGVCIQSYNNPCGLNSYVPGSVIQSKFDFATWDDWAHNTSKNPNVKVFLGAPGNIGARSGYEPLSGLIPIIDYIKMFPSWDASQAFANVGFIAGIKTALTDNTCQAEVIHQRYHSRLHM